MLQRARNRQRLKKIFKDPYFLLNFTLYKKAIVVNVFQQCAYIVIPELNRKGWFKFHQFVPTNITKSESIYDLSGLYIYREELFKKKFLPDLRCECEK